MVDFALSSLTINLLATGLASGASVGARAVRRALRKRQISEAIGEVATEFNKAPKQAIEEEHQRRDTQELAGLSTDSKAGDNAMTFYELYDRINQRDGWDFTYHLDSSVSTGPLNQRKYTASPTDPQLSVTPVSGASRVTLSEQRPGRGRSRSG